MAAKGDASIYFFTGDFADVLKRYAEGKEQIYATHNEVARLTHDLLDAGVKLTIYSYVTPEAKDERPLEGLRIISIGGSAWNDVGPLKAAVKLDQSEAIVAHFSTVALLQGVIAKSCRTMAVLANSYRMKGIGPFLERRQIAGLLNSPRFELVSNHCIPATSQLASMGVSPKRLIPWNIPLRYDPKDVAPKKLASGQPHTIAYAGGIRENKGTGNLIRAVAELKRNGTTIHCSIAGGGEIEQMQSLAGSLGISDQVTFLGLLPHAEVFELFRTSTLVAVPSQPSCTEGFPLTMFEAIASRTPIVCSDHPMFVPVMKDGITASVFPWADPKAFAAAIERVLGNGNLYADLSRNADLSWKALQGPADWRTLLSRWILEGPDSDWMRQHMLDALQNPQKFTQ